MGEDLIYSPYLRILTGFDKGFSSNSCYGISLLLLCIDCGMPLCYFTGEASTVSTEEAVDWAGQTSIEHSAAWFSFMEKMAICNWYHLHRHERLVVIFGPQSSSSQVLLPWSRLVQIIQIISTLYSELTNSLNECLIHWKCCYNALHFECSKSYTDFGRNSNNSIQ